MTNKGDKIPLRFTNAFFSSRLFNAQFCRGVSSIWSVQRCLFFIIRFRFCFISFCFLFFSRFTFCFRVVHIFFLLVYYVFRIENQNIPIRASRIWDRWFSIDFRSRVIFLGEGKEIYTYERWYLIWFPPNGLHIDYVKSVRWICADSVCECDVYRVLCIQYGLAAS